MATATKLKCAKCGRSLKESEFFKMRTGDRCDLCKDCLTQYIDNRNPETFLWILEKFDVPYIEEVWIKKTNDIYMKNPGRFGPKSVLGTYLRMMNMQQYKDETFADSRKYDKIVRSAEDEEPDPDREEKLRQQFEAGEISEVEYHTYSAQGPLPAEIKKVEFLEEIGQESSKSELEPESAQEPVQEEPPQQFNNIPTTYWTDQLEEEDIQYLMLKWGTVYSPQEWITMETMYQKYANEYDINVDREEVLKKMCKISLKMDLALDTGDITAAKNLSTVFDQLRKSGKFTEVQQKEKEEKTLDTIGELVAKVEQEGGIIPHLPQFDPNEYPQDVVDFTIKDLQTYIYNLVSKELGLGDLIESYIAKLEQAEKDDIADPNKGLVTSSEELEKEALTDQEVEDFHSFIENDIEAEAEELLRLMEQGLI